MFMYLILPKKILCLTSNTENLIFLVSCNFMQCSRKGIGIRSFVVNTSYYSLLYDRVTYHLLH
jgi:hypothetical protein